MSGGFRPRLYSIAPGAPFLATVAQTLCDGVLTPDFTYDPANPLSLAGVTVFVPTRRAARALRSEFVDLLGGRSAILPVIRPLGETDEDAGFFDEAPPALIDLAEPLSGPGRLLELARLILAWRNRLPEAIQALHSGSPLIAPASPADAIWLARDLAELIDAIETEERDWSDLDRLKVENYADWWKLTLEFLKIAAEWWPARLAELKRSSPSRHSTSLLDAEARRLAGLAEGEPVIVAGSTGSVPAAARLIATVAKMPNGTVILPGLDRTMPEDHWREIGAADLSSPVSDAARRSHPQYGLHRLLEKLGVTREDVLPLGAVPAPLEARAAILSRALGPSQATDGWTMWRRSLPAETLEQAFAGVSLIEAANEREEALAIAIALRLALEKPGRTGEASRAALITPDRNLARRVSAELVRFGIEADDSAGTPLAATHPGTLMTLLLEAALRPGDPVAAAALLHHPLARFGMERDRYRRAAEALELTALRGGVGETDIARLSPLLASRLPSFRKAEERGHAPHWRPASGDPLLDEAAELARRLAAAVEPLSGVFLKRRAGGGLTASLALSEWAERTGRALEAAATDEAGDLAALWSGEAGEKLAGLLAAVMENDGGVEADGPQWIDITTALMASEAVKPRAMSHPRVFIFGTLEARLQDVDTMILGGLNEGSWPDLASSNPFISRSMKGEMGLEPPERRIGQLAHDFEMANGTADLIYSRSLRQGSAPTVASRFLQRLLALGGADFAATLRARGDLYRAYAAAIDRGENQRQAGRPSPTPPAEIQPKRYSFSEVGRLRRDPYSVYARRVLKLDPLDPFNSDPGVAERGTLYHAILDRFVNEGHAAATPAAREAMARIVDEAFAAEGLPPHIDAVWRPRFREVAAAFLDWEARRQGETARSLTEVRANMPLEALGIALTGSADRIDLMTDGTATIIDYKTGSSPSKKQARTLLEPQLPLEAAALKAGAFRGLPAQEAGELLYVRLRPGRRFDQDIVNNEAAKDGKSAAVLGDEALAQFSRFVSVLQTGERGFTSRLVPFKQFDYGGEYDHLARVAEWSTAETEEDGDNGE
ncbi:double-strand break repair protein AddB [Rhizobiaceae bacterium BDR2-2]|uniref:Double-strand break repair protein AddB n=1 Tax=Ectorhizobium quercum TaxID=2965071 RepID=A0AAE3SWS0_9HYPH|nr:double-strand break repair protein AddB [Ectorhizobium quercum]MCX8999472.1 double-strand break repair protein AddB [Ectorhizobium quercum]